MTELITSLINENKPFIFAKFGDGEYAAMNSWYGANCDGDPFTAKLKDGLHSAIKYYSQLDNAYIGKWHSGSHVADFLQSLTNHPIHFVNYHTCIFDNTTFQTTDMLNLYKSIQNSPRKKILIGNELLVKATSLFGLSHHIVVPYRNWVENDYNRILQSVLEVCDGDPSPMILTCAGMGSKVIIKDLHALIPNGMFIDFGSGLDHLCTRKSSRGANFTYSDIETYLKDILPENWNDPQFEGIYERAKTAIGIHLAN
jgi:hypothetical protein